MKRLLIPLVLALSAWLLFVSDRAPGTDAARRGFPLDDAWIHMVYARSVVEEGGFHFNQGEPEAGMTSPLWVVVLAGMLRIVGPDSIGAVVLGAKILSLAFGLAAAILVYLLARELGERAFGAILAASLFALDPALVFAAASGMEIQLFIALVLLSLLLSLRGRWTAAAVAAGLSVVARPEGLVLFPIYALALLRSPTRPQATRKMLAGALALLPAAAYAMFCLHATGHALPNTFYAKFAPHNPINPSLLALGWTQYVHGNLPWFTLEAGSVLALLGALRWFRRDRGRTLLVLGSGLLFFVATVASRILPPGHHFYWARWVAPAFPFLHLAIAAGVEEVRAGFTVFMRRRGRRPVIAATRGRPLLRWGATALALVLLAARLPGALRARADLFAWNAQNIEELNVEPGKWVAANLPPDAVIAVNDAGALRYFGGRKTIDLVGLNNHRVLSRDPSLGARPLETLGVDYLVIFPSLYPGMVKNLPLTPIHEARAPKYTICDAQQDRVVVYRLDRPQGGGGPSGPRRQLP